jgi:tetratricopeptide (TPR) repeat protein
MKQLGKKITTLAVLVLLLVPVAAAEQSQESSPRASEMSFWQARRAIIAASKYMQGSALHYIGPVNRGSIRFTSDSFEFDVTSSRGTEHHKVDFTAVEPIIVKCQREQCFLRNEAGKPLPKDGAGKVLRYLWWSMPDGANPARSICPVECLRAAESFAIAFNRLRALANDNRGALSEFRQQAANWRALPSKPPIPEAVRVQRLLAEDAMKQKEPEEALNRYEQGLKIYPTWPQGCFNAALIAASLGFYDEAVEHMQGYLELVPDAQDAQSARDQIAIWQHKAGQHAPGVPR